MFGDGRGRAFQGHSSARETHLPVVTQGGAATVTYSRSLRERVSLREHVSLPTQPVCDGSAGELVAESRACEKRLGFFRGQAGRVC